MSQVSSSLGLVGMGSVLLSSTSVAWALGMGGITNNTVLGAPLDVSVPVLGSADEKTPPPSDCIKPMVEAGEGVLNPRQLRTILQPGHGDVLYVVQVVSDVRIYEPVVNVSLSLGCQSPLTRRFVLFVDPPGMNMAGPAAPKGASASSAAPVSIRETPSESKPLRALSGVSGTGGARRSVSRSQSGTVAAEAAAGREPRRARSAQRGGGSSPEAAASGPRLSLEAPNIVAVAPASAASDPAEDEALENQLALLTQLEAVLKQVSAENQAVQSGMAALQAKLKAAELELQAERSRHREQPPIVWVLSGVIGLLSLGLVALWWRQRRQPKPFFQRSSVFGDGPRDDLPEPPVLDSMPSQLQPLEPELVDQRGSPLIEASPEPAVAAAPVKREIVVDEVVDLDQQADFFIALGQDQAAIDLLNAHTNQGNSPLPYLKLIDIHRRRGDRMAYEQLRLRFHRRFNARVPEWDAAATAGRGLEDYPEVQKNLESSWPQAASALKLLEGFLFRREGQGTTFDLLAFRDLLMLHAVAKDLLSQNEAQGVDLELPLQGA